MISGMDRRSFLKSGAAAVAAMGARNAVGANDRVRVAIVGLRGRGFEHIKAGLLIDIDIDIGDDDRVGIGRDALNGIPGGGYRVHGVTFLLQRGLDSEL